MLAAEAGRAAICRLLLEEGADPELADGSGRSASDWAKLTGHHDLALALQPAYSLDVSGSDSPREVEGDGGSAPDDEAGLQWEAEDEPIIGHTDASLALRVATVQMEISEHRFRQESDAWSDAEISIPQANRIGRPKVELPAATEKLFSCALAGGWTSYDHISLTLRKADEAHIRLAIAALELSGVRLVKADAWNTHSDVDGAPGRHASRHPALDDAIELYAELLGEATDPLEIYSASIDRHIAPDRDEEARIFKNLSEARHALLQCVRKHHDAYASALAGFRAKNAPAQESSDGDDPEEEREGMPSGIPGSDADWKALEDLVIWNDEESDADINGATLPYSALEALLDIMSPIARDAPHYTSLARSLERFRRVRDRVAASNLKLVVWVRKRYFRSSPLPAMDLVQEGNIGLLKAIEKYDPARGNRFSTYAVWWIRQAMSRAVHDQARQIRLPVHASEVLARLERLERSHRTRHNTAIDAKEAAEVLECPERLVEVLRKAPLKPVTLDVSPDGTAWLAPVVEGSPCYPDFRHMEEERRRHISSQLMDLNPREERVVRMRFGIGTPNDMTLEEVGQFFGITRERIRQIEARALKRLNHPLRRRRLEYLL